MPMISAKSAEALPALVATGSPIPRILQLAKKVFRAQHVDATPDSSASAMSHVLSRLVEPDETVMDMWTSSTSFIGDQPAARTSPSVRWIGYGLGDDGFVDYDAAEALAAEFRPAVIICGAAGYSRTIDFARLRRIADQHDALLVADISAVTGLVAAQYYPSPIDLADVTVARIETSTGTSGSGLILAGVRSRRLVGGNGRTLSQRLGTAAMSAGGPGPTTDAVVDALLTLSRIRSATPDGPALLAADRCGENLMNSPKHPTRKAV